MRYHAPMPDDRKALAARTEALAAEPLVAKGYRVRERNFRLRLGEVDLICEDGQTLVFVEVKARRGGRFGSAAEAVTPRKQAKLLAIAEIYMASRPGRACRFDIVTVTLGRSAPVIEHLVDAFP